MNKYDINMLNNNVFMSYERIKCDVLFPVESISIRMFLSSLSSAIVYYNIIQFYKLEPDFVTCKFDLYSKYCFVNYKNYLTDHNKEIVKNIIINIPRYFLIFNLSVMRSYVERNITDKADLLIMKDNIKEGMYHLRSNKNDFEFIFNGES